MQCIQECQVNASQLDSYLKKTKKSWLLGFVYFVSFTSFVSYFIENQYTVKLKPIIE